MNRYAADILSLPGDARAGWRTLGASGVIEALAERSVYRLVRTARYGVFERDLTTVRPVTTPPGVVIREIAPAEIPRLEPLMMNRAYARYIARAEGRTCFAAFRDDTIVGYSWWSSAIDGPLDLSPLVLPPDANFHGFVAVERRERRRRIGSALLACGGQWFREQGIRRSWFLVRSTNQLGGALARRRVAPPARPVAELRYWKLPFATKRWVTPANAAASGDIGPTTQTE